MQPVRYQVAVARQVAQDLIGKTPLKKLDQQNTLEDKHDSEAYRKSHDGR